MIFLRNADRIVNFLSSQEEDFLLIFVVIAIQATNQNIMIGDKTKSRPASIAAEAMSSCVPVPSE